MDIWPESGLFKGTYNALAIFFAANTQALVGANIKKKDAFSSSASLSPIWCAVIFLKVILELRIIFPLAVGHARHLCVYMIYCAESHWICLCMCVWPLSSASSPPAIIIYRRELYNFQFYNLIIPMLSNIEW